MIERNREQLITMCIAVALFAAFGFGLFRPRARVLAAIKQESKRLGEESELLTKEYDTLSVATQKQIRALREEVDRSRKRIPDRDHTVHFESDIDKLCRKYGFRHHSFSEQKNNRFGYRTSAEGIIEKRFNITFEATFDSLYAFIQEVEARETLTEIKHISVQRHNGTLKTMIGLSIYYGVL